MDYDDGDDDDDDDDYYYSSFSPSCCCCCSLLLLLLLQLLLPPLSLPLLLLLVTGAPPLAVAAPKQKSSATTHTHTRRASPSLKTSPFPIPKVAAKGNHIFGKSTAHLTPTWGNNSSCQSEKPAQKSLEILAFGGLEANFLQTLLVQTFPTSKISGQSSTQSSVSHATQSQPRRLRGL